jgi:transcriptional regulator with PAS, ATPase and Fis domain
VTGETGAGKELAAREFHARGAHPDGPFVAVNCATIPQGLAERLLFGAKKGVYSGADADSEGYLQAAHGGTIFLDEIAELDLQVQAKLLRVLETREVLPLGASKPKTIDVRVVSATHGDLRKRVSDGKFREDLYFRIGKPVVALPSLRERGEDIPWLVAEALRASGRSAHVSLIEAALLRAWPGNVRELLAEIAAAARASEDANAESVEAIHLDEDAGKAFGEDDDEDAPDDAPRAAGPDRAAIERALRKERGNVSRAAAELGVHRTQLRRWITALALDPKSFASG